jgi:hypothetical protein
MNRRKLYMLVAAGSLIACFLAGAFLSPFGRGEALAGQPAVTWQPRVITPDGRSVERPFGDVLAILARTEPWHRSARDLSAAEIADLLGRPSGAAIVPAGRKRSLSIRANDRARICVEYLPRDKSWYLVFCS